MEIVWRNTDELIPYERNQKKHDAKQIQNVANSIKRFGWQQPIVIDEKDVVVIGHCRLLAAKKLKQDKVPVTVASGLTEDEIRELRIADNKTNESEWEFDFLTDDVKELSFDGFDFDFSGGIADDPVPIETTEDDFDDFDAVTTKTKRGDLWQLGEHYLLCGDSTSDDDVHALMGDDHAKILFTSPPYSDMRDYNGDKDLSVGNLVKFIPTYRKYADYQCVNLGLQRKDHEIVQYWDEYIQAAKDCGYKLMAWNVWDKMSVGNIGMAKAMFPIRHEWIFVFGTDFFEINITIPKKDEYIISKDKAGMCSKRNKDGTTSPHTKGDTSHAYKQMESVLQQMSEHGTIRQEHPATFPVGLPAEYIKAMTDPDDVVVEPFGGSGTTLIACEQLGRKCRMMELDEHYCDVIINRWETFTGEKAVLVNG